MRGQGTHPEIALFHGEREVTWTTFWGSLLYQGHITCGTNWQASYLICLGQKALKSQCGFWPLKFYTQFLRVGDPLKSGQFIRRMLHPLNAICSLSLTAVTLSCLQPLPLLIQ